MCKGKRQILRCLLMAFCILALIECGIHTYLVGYPDGSPSGIATDILYCALLLTAAVVGLIHFCEDRIPMVIVYASLILALIILDLLNIGVGRAKIEGKAIVELAWEENKLHPALMDELQRKFKCCGKSGADDYPNFYDRAIPKSCINPLKQSPYRDGCIDTVKDVDYSILYWIVLQFHILWGVHAGFLLFWVRNQYLNRRRNSDLSNQRI